MASSNEINSGKARLYAASTAEDLKDMGFAHVYEAPISEHAADGVCLDVAVAGSSQPSRVVCVRGALSDRSLRLRKLARKAAKLISSVSLALKVPNAHMCDLDVPHWLTPAVCVLCDR